MARNRDRDQGSGFAVRRSGARRYQDAGAPISRRRDEDRPRKSVVSYWPVAAAVGAGLALFASFFEPGSEEAVPTPGGDVAAAQPASEAPFDYYVLALSWSPAYCRENPRGDQCGQGRRFILHGLWPQFEEGWPQDCASAYAEPSGALLRRYVGLAGSEGLLAYQWRKHGACSGLSPEAYFETAERAVAGIEVPAAFERLRQDRVVNPRAIETEFIGANPELTRDSVTIKCANNQFSEVRICLTLALEPRRCGRDVVRDCAARGVDLPAPR